MKRISLSERSREKLLHIEAPGCIINIRVGLADRHGRKVTHISVLADGDRYAGEPPWWIDARYGMGAQDMRVVQVDDKQTHAQAAAMARALARVRPLSLRDEVAGVTKPGTMADFGAAYHEEGED